MYFLCFFGCVNGWWFVYDWDELGVYDDCLRWWNNIRFKIEIEYEWGGKIIYEGVF